VSSFQDSISYFSITQGSGCCAASTLGFAVPRFQRADSHLRLHPTYVDERYIHKNCVIISANEVKPITLSELLGDKRQEILQTAAFYGASNIRVFGSQARGEARPDSDIDLLVTLDPERSLIDLIGLKQSLEDMLNCKIDVVTESSVSPYLRPKILQDAVAL
jgi:uncharacterized protein